MELSLDAILAVAEGMKEDLQRQANQGVLQNNLNRALGALASIGVVDDFVYRLKIRSGSQLGLPKIPRKTKSPLRKHLEAEANRDTPKRDEASVATRLAGGRTLRSASLSQELPEQLLLPNAGGPIPAKKRRAS